jgi:bifunctional non-homologous end joining protein LigD
LTKANAKLATVPTNPSRPEPLAEYARKRDFGATPEPAGKKRSTSPTALRFVIQKHRASRLHYDFRLEVGGVLASWAVPKGPSRNPAEKRLAMHVEDHPFDYRDFEGIIPPGNYGAGEVIVWDRGTYRLAEGSDPGAEIAAGKIKFVLTGKKLRGMWTLVRIKHRSGEDGDPWLLIKDHDDGVDPDWDIEAHAESVKSGKTLADLAQTKSPKTWQSDRPAATAARPKRDRVKAAAKREPLPREPKPMLATLADAPFDDPAWLFELKWDGYRAIATIDANGNVDLRSRNGNDLLGQFGELADLGIAFASRPIVVDGEVVMLDEHGHSSFQALQSRDKRFAKGKPTSETGVTFVAFDLLYADGRNMRDEPLEERKRLLESLIVPNHRVMYSKHVIGKGTQLYELVESQGIEGIVAKRRQSPYRGTRSREWLKIKAAKRQEFVIGGWTEPRGSRKGFGALLLGVYEGKKLVYSGHVGTGFDAKLLAGITQELQANATETSPFAVTPKANTPAHFVKPKLVAEIKFTEWTHDALLRHPVFLGLRSDKKATSVVREREIAATERD